MSSSSSSSRGVKVETDRVGDADLDVSDLNVSDLEKLGLVSDIDAILEKLGPDADKERLAQIRERWNCSKDIFLVAGPRTVISQVKFMQT